MNRHQQEVQANKEHNATKDYSHITNPYLLDKLDAGLIKYEPENWELYQLDPMDENGGRK